jgi:hypothetical protein
MTPRTIPIALTLDDGSVAVMQYVAEGAFSTDAAVKMAERGEINDLRASREVEVDGVPALLVPRATTDEAIESEISRGVLASRVVSWRRVDSTELPTDRRYRNSWRDHGDRIDLDLPKARAERLDQLRRSRQPILDQLDRDHARATDQGDREEAARIAARRQQLRDMPMTVAPALAAATTADDLDAVNLE